MQLVPLCTERRNNSVYTRKGLRETIQVDHTYEIETRVPHRTRADKLYFFRTSLVLRLNNSKHLIKWFNLISAPDRECIKHTTHRKTWLSTHKRKRMTLELFHRLNWQDSKVVPSSRLDGQGTTHLTMVWVQMEHTNIYSPLRGAPCQPSFPVVHLKPTNNYIYLI